ncbi:MAG: B12-binding domain-containing protein [Candidatus Odinarchaeota archaeon]
MEEAIVIKDKKKSKDYINYLNNIIEAVSSLDFFTMKEAIRQAMDAKVPIIEIVKNGILNGLDESGDMGLILAAEALEGEVQCIDEENRLNLAESSNYNGKVVVGTIEGDIHNLGKSILIALMKSYGMDFIDLGTDVSPEKFEEVAQQPDVKVVGISFLLSSSEPAIKRAMNLLKNGELASKIKVILGGASVTPEIAEETNADAYATDALQGVDIIDNWLRD